MRLMMDWISSIERCGFSAQYCYEPGEGFVSMHTNVKISLWIEPPDDNKWRPY